VVIAESPRLFSREIIFQGKLHDWPARAGATGGGETGHFLCDAAGRRSVISLANFNVFSASLYDRWRAIGNYVCSSSSRSTAKTTQCRDTASAYAWLPLRTARGEYCKKKGERERKKEIARA